jgi:hypothetical protein
MCQPGLPTQKIVLLFNKHFSVLQGIIQTTVLCLLTFYKFINPSHDLVLSMLDNTLSVDDENSSTYCWRAVGVYVC